MYSLHYRSISKLKLGSVMVATLDTTFAKHNSKHKLILRDRLRWS